MQGGGDAVLMRWQWWWGLAFMTYKAGEGLGRKSETEQAWLGFGLQ
jgi:hypothetical protein